MPHARARIGEIKKEATAKALRRSRLSSWRLERGLDGFVIADVTQRAGYARRTFANHFSCKEEAVASVLFAGADQSGGFHRRPTRGTSLLDAMHELLRSQMSAEMFDGRTSSFRSAGSTPPWSRTSSPR